MKTLLTSRLLKSFWTHKFPRHRLFHLHCRLLSSPILAQYEAVRCGDQPLPENFNFAGDVLDKWSQMEKEGKRPSNPALWWINGRGGEVRWSFEELGVQSRKVANTLLDQCGLRKGDRIVVILPRIPEWWLVTVACMRTGIQARCHHHILWQGVPQINSTLGKEILADNYNRKPDKDIEVVEVTVPVATPVLKHCDGQGPVASSYAPEETGMVEGIVFIPGTTQLTAKDIQYRLQASKAKCIITTDLLAPAVDSVAAACNHLKSKLLVSEGKRDGWLNFNELRKEAPADHPCVKTKMDDTMVVYFTSGTTGAPKMVEHSQGSLAFRSVIHGRCWVDFTPSDIMWCTADTGWVVAALGSMYDPWVSGSSVFVHNLPQVEPTTILNTLSRFPITAMLGAPTLFRMLVLQHDLASYKFTNLQFCMSGGEPLNPEVLDQWKNKTGVTIYEIYGQTETGIICAVRRGMTIKPGSMGKACSPFDVQIIDENANVLPPGEEGEIAIRVKPQRPLGLFSRYIDNPEKTAAVERGSFYVTGDRGIMDKEGYFWFIGRADDLINSAGYRIGPFDVESALLQHPAVAEAAAISSPDPLRGEVVKAFVVLSLGYASEDKGKLTLELQEHVKKVTAPYKYPRKVEFVQELPKTTTGKIRRNELRNKEWGRV